MEEEKDKGKYKSLIIAGIIAVLVITAFVFAIVKLISKSTRIEISFLICSKNNLSMYK